MDEEQSMGLRHSSLYRNKLDGPLLPREKKDELLLRKDVDQNQKSHIHSFHRENRSCAVSFLIFTNNFTKQQIISCPSQEQQFIEFIPLLKGMSQSHGFVLHSFPQQ